MLSITTKKIKGDFTGPKYNDLPPPVWLTHPYKYYYYFISNNQVWRLNCNTWEWENVKVYGIKPHLCQNGAVHQNVLYVPTNADTVTYKFDFSTHSWGTIKTTGKAPKDYLNKFPTVSVTDFIAVYSYGNWIGALEDSKLYLLNLNTKEWRHRCVDETLIMSSWGNHIFMLGYRYMFIYNVETENEVCAASLKPNINVNHCYQWTYKNYWYFCQGAARNERKTILYRFDMETKQWSSLQANDYLPQKSVSWATAVGDTAIILQYSSFDTCTCISLKMNISALMRILEKEQLVDVEFQFDNSKKRPLMKSTCVGKKQKLL